LIDPFDSNPALYYMALSDVVGHRKVISRLRRAIDSERVSSSYMFYGEDGIGKRYTALNFAKALNCKNSKDGCSLERPCASCRKIDSESHPDLIFISPEKGLIKVEKIRALEDFLTLKPFEMGYKVVIIDKADAMNQEAANAFLKTLEEPPSKSVIILITSNPAVLPDTVHSRCVKIGFRPLSGKDCKIILEKMGRAQAEEASVRLSMGRPSVLLEGDIIKRRDMFIDSLKDMTMGKPPWKDREDMEEWLDLCLIFLRDLAVFKETKNKECLLNPDISEFISKASTNPTLRDIIDCYLRLLKVRRSLRFNLNKNITWNYIDSIIKGTIRGIS